MFTQRSRFHRQKSSGAYMQGDEAALDTALLQLLKNGFREMKPRRRSGHRAVVPGINGLITLAVRRLHCAANIGWERDQPSLVQ